MRSLCSGGCGHDAIAMRRCTENQYDANGNAKNRAIEIVLEESTGRDLQGDETRTSGGWLRQPLSAGTLIYTIDTGYTYEADFKNLLEVLAP